MSGMTSAESPQQETAMDGSGRALKLQTDSPHLVNIGGDRLSTSVTLHPIPQGRVTVGCGPGVDIPVHGTGVLPVHCRIENSEGVVTIYPLSDNLSIDGDAITRPTRLSQGVMLTIGRSNYLRFNHPAEAKIMKSVLPNPRISMAPIQFEPEPSSHQPKFAKKPPLAPPKKPHSTSRESLIESGVDEPTPSSIMTKVSKFEYLAQQNFKKSISPKVFASNSITVNTPAKDVLGRSPPDLQNYTKNLPQNALNYAELNANQAKTADRPLFGRKSPQYVNVAISEPKVINNRVIIYENGCVPKSHNVNLDHNELNNKTSSCNKNINVNKTNGFRSVTPGPISSAPKPEKQRRSGSMGELNACLERLSQRFNDAEVKRTQAQQERIKEQEIGVADQARLEEILHMCVEYEKQAQNEKNKITPNRIKTNGSLPRDKRQYGPLSPSYQTTPPPSPGGVLDAFHPQPYHHQHSDNTPNSHSYENVSYNHIQTTIQKANEKINGNNNDIRCHTGNGDDFRAPNCASPYENVQLQPNHSPRTRIKTIATATRENSVRETAEIIENKFAILETEQYLLQNTPKVPESTPKKDDSPKFIFPLDDSSIHDGQNSAPSSSNAKKIDKLKIEKRQLVDRISAAKRELTEIDAHEDELNQSIELEHALIAGEAKCKMLERSKLEARKATLFAYSQEIGEKMAHSKLKQEKDQRECQQTLEEAQARMKSAEERLAATNKSQAEYEAVFGEFLKAQAALDNEQKVYEDLEFHHLEKEADALATREEIQREIADINKEVEVNGAQINDLEQQKLNTSKNGSFESKTMLKRQSELFAQLERNGKLLKRIEAELAIFAGQESDLEDSTDSEGEQTKYLLEKFKSNSSSNIIRDMSCSIIVCNGKMPIEHAYNMSQSFNEKLLEEKSILESGMAKFPSQDDIDRFSKVTLNAPINIDEEKKMGQKTIESLRDIERMRHLHLCQQGSQIMEQERQRVLELKQRVQEKVRSEWEQKRLDCSSVGSNEYEDDSQSKNILEQKTENEPKQAETLRPTSYEPDSPRPMSEMSETSVEQGPNMGTGRRRAKIGDKQRPLTRYLPIRSSDLDLRQHIESAGHQVFACPHVVITTSTCRGFLHKKGSKLNGWSKRWFVFDRNKHTFTYYNDKSEKKARGGAYFQAIEEVYMDHLNNVKSPNPQLTFIVKTHERFYYLLAPSPEAVRIWMDVIFTGAEGYQEFDMGT